MCRTTPTKTPGKALSREEWLCKRREVVNQESATTPVKRMKPSDVAEVWTPEHDKELNFNAKKQSLRVFEGLRSKAIKLEELPEDVRSMAGKHFATIEKNMLARERKELGAQQILSREPPSWETLQGLCVRVPDSLRSAGLDDKMATLMWDVSPDALKADVYIIEDPAAISDILKLAIGLSGGWIMTPAAVLGQAQGRCFLKAKHGGHARRKSFMTAAFKNANPEVAAIFEANVSNSFKLLADIDAFAIEKDKATKAKAPASVIALITEDERHIFANIPHVFSFPEALDFFFKLDLAKSCRL